MNHPRNSDSVGEYTAARRLGPGTAPATAKRFLDELEARRSPDRSQGHDGLRMRDVFALAKEFIEMPLTEIEALLEHPSHEARVGAVSIMDFQARRKRTSEERRRELFELYMRRHDRIDNWDLVDRSAPYVVGGYLADKPRDVLYDLARSENVWERRTAIVSTYYFIRQGDTTETFGIAEVLVADPQDMVQRAVGGWIREAGKRDPERLLAFLDKHAATMPRTALRYAVEHLDEQRRRDYLGLAKGEKGR